MREVFLTAVFGVCMIVAGIIIGQNVHCIRMPFTGDQTCIIGNPLK